MRHMYGLKLCIYFTHRTPPETLNELKHDLLSYCRHVAAGLSLLSSKGFVHRDLAARNILVSSDDVCKVKCLYNHTAHCIVELIDC